jgi:hypothetical protein
MSAVEPQLRLNLNPNVWNLAVIDNIDMKDVTFQYGNIYDATRATAHATLRMAFQFQHPQLVNSGGEPLRDDQSMFGVSPIMELWQRKVDMVFNQLVSQEQIFSIEHINAAIRKHVDSALFVTTPNVVILEP